MAETAELPGALMAAAPPPLVLASASAARAQLLRSAGLEVHCQAAAVDEEGVKASLKAEGATAAQVAETLAELKAQRVAVRQLTMRVLSDAFIDAYLEAAGPAVTASVGAYQLEGLGAQLFTKVEGDFFTVLGLPLLPLLDFLRLNKALPS